MKIKFVWRIYAAIFVVIIWAIAKDRVKAEAPEIDCATIKNFDREWMNVCMDHRESAEPEPDSNTYKPFYKTFEREFENTNLLITVFWYDTIEEFQEDTDEKDKRVRASSMCEVKPDMNIGYCDLYLVRPTTVDGDATISIGHEVLHGLIGHFHK